MIEFGIESNAVPIVGRADPIPCLRIQCWARGRTDELANPAGRLKFVASGLSANVSIGGVLIPSATVEATFRYGIAVGNILNQALTCQVQLPRYLLDAIERVRVHDVQISLSVELRYHAVGGAPDQVLQTVQGHMQVNVSQKQWLDALAAMGYSGGWVIEVERPQVEGWPAVVGFLDKAAERIASRQPEEAIAQCRAAWGALGPLVDHEQTSIAAEVDRGSTPEEGEPTKSERIQNLRKMTLKWAHTGAHPEYYAASMDDALLAYRMTVAMVGYLSRKAVQAEVHAAAAERRGGA